MKEMWSGGCQSRLYQSWVKGTLSTMVLMGPITLGVIMCGMVMRMKEIIYLRGTGGGQAPGDKVILDIHNYQGRFRLNNLYIIDLK